MESQSQTVERNSHLIALLVFLLLSTSAMRAQGIGSLRAQNPAEVAVIKALRLGQSDIFPPLERTISPGQIYTLLLRLQRKTNAASKDSVSPSTPTDNNAPKEVAEGPISCRQLSPSERSDNATTKYLRGDFVKQLMLLDSGSIAGGSLNLNQFSIGAVHFGDDHSPITLHLNFINDTFTGDFEFKGEMNRGISFVDSTFQGSLDLNYSHIKGDVRISDANFIPCDGGLPTLSISQATIDGNLQFSSSGNAPTTFLSDGLRVSNFQFADGGAITNVWLQHLTANSLNFTDHLGKEYVTQNIDLSSSVIQEDLALNLSKVNNLRLEGVEVKGRTFIIGGISENLDLTSASLGKFTYFRHSNPKSLENNQLNPKLIRVADPTWPKQLSIDGLTFNHIDVYHTDRLNRFTPYIDDTFQFFHRATFYQPAFSLYQTQLENSGQGENATEVNTLIHKRRRSQELFLSNNFEMEFAALVKYALDLVQQYFFGYGRDIAPPILWSIVFIVLGYFIFHNSGQMEMVRDDSSRAYSGFWYSLELFLPIVDLGIAKGWRPRRECKHRLAYARIHQLAGWILIPVMVGILTGSLK